MNFDADVRAGDSGAGLFFDPSVSEPIDGVIALYYADELQFIPNPFSPRDLEPLRQFLPMSMELGRPVRGPVVCAMTPARREEYPRLPLFSSARS